MKKFFLTLHGPRFLFHDFAVPKKPTTKKSVAKSADAKPAKKATTKKSISGKLTEKEGVIVEPKTTIVSDVPEKAVATPKPIAAHKPLATTPQAVSPKPRLEKYFEAVGRRKRATARVRLYTSNPQNSAEAGNIVVNEKPYKSYFSSERLWLIAEDSLKKLKSMNRFRATVKVSGGGTHAQAEAIRHGLARTLTLFDANFRKRLKRAGYLTRDPREKERKKYGLKKARRRPQWAKR